MYPIIRTVITVLAVLSGVIGLLFGLHRRTYRALLRAGTMVLASVLAALLSAPIGSLIVPALFDPSVGMIPQEMMPFAELPFASDLLTGVGSVLIGLVLYLPLFVILSLLMLIPYEILSKRIVKRDPETKKIKDSFKGDRPVGAAVGAVAGVLVLALVLMPVFGLVRIVTSVADVLPLEGEVRETVSDVSSDPFLDTAGKVTSPLFDLLTSMTVGGKRVSLSRELVDLLSTWDIPAYIDAFNDDSITPDMMRELLGRVSEDDFLCEAIAETIRAAIEAWREGGEFLGAEKPEFDPPFDGLINELLGAMSDSDASTVKADLGTVGKLFSVLEPYGLLADDAEPDIMALLSDPAFVSPLVNILTENRHTASVLPSFVATLVSEVSGGFGMEEIDGLDYETVRSKLAALGLDELKEEIGRFVETISEISVLQELPEEEAPSAVGSLMTKLASSVIFRDAAPSIISALMAVPEVEEIMPGASALFDSEAVMAKIADGTLDGANLMESVSHTMDLISTVTESDMTLSEKEKLVRENSDWLKTNMQTSSAEAIGDMITPELMEALGVSHKHSDGVAAAAKLLFEEIYPGK